MGKRDTDDLTRAGNVPGDIVPVTPHNDNDLAFTAMGLYIETGGAVCFITKNGGTRTVNFASNSTFVCRITRVKATGTTATGIHAFQAEK